MRIAVVGLWHLGTVTAACLAEAGHEVTGIDGDAHVISGLQEGRFPVEEPGLAALTQKHIRTGKLRFSALFEAACDQDVVWITFDTPVDDDDVADVNYVFRRAAALLPMMADDAIMLVSSQMPVGSLTKLEGAYRDLALGNRVRFAYSPENL